MKQEVETIAREWGSSIGVIIPKEVVEAERIKKNDKLILIVKKKPATARRLFGKFTNWKKSTQQLKDEMRKGWD